MKQITRVGSDERARNPFRDPLVTELIEEPKLYRKMFSERILVGETLSAFLPVNTVLVGPQGSGKSMILNLIRYRIIAEWVSKTHLQPAPLRHIAPFLGISVNLTRINLQAFGRRPISKVMKRDPLDRDIDLACAADYLNHYLFSEFVKGLQFVFSNEGERLRDWMHIKADDISMQEIVKTMSSWRSWFGYYVDCSSLDCILAKCDKRLNTWLSFLNSNIEEIPEDIWETKSTIGEPLHAMGNLLNSIKHGGTRLPLFVVIDQYEVLPELNRTYGTSLQRLVNTLIKARDPVVFYKIGARTYDWGQELRIWGAESRIEVQRDYAIINLSDILIRGENSKGWLFPQLALDVAHKRLRITGNYRAGHEDVKDMLGPWSADKESWLYFQRKKQRRFITAEGPPKPVIDGILEFLGPDASPLEVRLASAWALQKCRKHWSEGQILKQLKTLPWHRLWWHKERIVPALIQIATMSNSRKLYYGWRTVNYLSGANITAFLLICSEIWDMAAKMGLHPLRTRPLSYEVQTEGIYNASQKWAMRDRNEHTGGRKRYQVISQLGPAIHDGIVADLAISNPGESGFSLREADLWGDYPPNSKNGKVSDFLERCVSWAYLEERPHQSRKREAASRRKWYLHPLLSPVYGIPHIRVKEPLYVTIDQVFDWIFSEARHVFSKKRGRGLVPPRHKRVYQARLLL
ncbi:MAG: hypothetical protein MUO80_07560 [Dehalococcoidia bacterium]|nr:hypothetical protein [Dehalococcoidia bacterium]